MECSLTRGLNFTKTQQQVLILVLMECSLTIYARANLNSHARVLILVLMEYSLTREISESYSDDNPS